MSMSMSSAQSVQCQPPTCMSFAGPGSVQWQPIFVATVQTVSVTSVHQRHIVPKFVTMDTEMATAEKSRADDREICSLWKSSSILPSRPGC